MPEFWRNIPITKFLACGSTRRIKMRQPSLVEPGQSTTQIGSQGFFEIILREEQHEIIWHTFPETNIAPENRPAQKETSIPTIHFQVRAVSFREGNTSPNRNSYRKKRPKGRATRVDLAMIGFRNPLFFLANHLTTKVFVKKITHLYHWGCKNPRDLNI